MWPHGYYIIARDSILRRISSQYAKPQPQPRTETDAFIDGNQGTLTVNIEPTQTIKSETTNTGTDDNTANVEIISVSKAFETNSPRFEQFQHKINYAEEVCGILQENNPNSSIKIGVIITGRDQFEKKIGIYVCFNGKNIPLTELNFKYDFDQSNTESAKDNPDYRQIIKAIRENLPQAILKLFPEQPEEQRKALAFWLDATNNIASLLDIPSTKEDEKARKEASRQKEEQDKTPPQNTPAADNTKKTIITPIPPPLPQPHQEPSIFDLAKELNRKFWGWFTYDGRFRDVKSEINHELQEALKLRRELEFKKLIDKCAEPAIHWADTLSKCSRRKDAGVVIDYNVLEAKNNKTLIITLHRPDRDDLTVTVPFGAIQDQPEDEKTYEKNLDPRRVLSNIEDALLFYPGHLKDSDTELQVITLLFLERFKAENLEHMALTQFKRPKSIFIKETAMTPAEEEKLNAGIRQAIEGLKLGLKNQPALMKGENDVFLPSAANNDTPRPPAAEMPLAVRGRRVSLRQNAFVDPIVRLPPLAAASIVKKEVAPGPIRLADKLNEKLLAGMSEEDKNQIEQWLGGRPLSPDLLLRIAASNPDLAADSMQTNFGSPERDELKAQEFFEDVHKKNREIHGVDVNNLNPLVGDDDFKGATRDDKRPLLPDANAAELIIDFASRRIEKIAKKGGNWIAKWEKKLIDPAAETFNRWTTAGKARLQHAFTIANAVCEQVDGNEEVFAKLHQNDNSEPPAPSPPSVQ